MSYRIQSVRRKTQVRGCSENRGRSPCGWWGDFGSVSLSAAEMNVCQRQWLRITTESC